MKTSLMTLGLIAATVLVVQSCNKEDVTPTEQTGTMKVKMTDAPANYASLNVEISKIEAFVQNKGWVTLNNQTQIVSVLSLTNGTESIVANSSVSAGLYSKLRFTFGNTNSVTMNGTSGNQTYNLGFGTNTTHQVEVEINEQVQTNATTEVLLDFNAATSVIAFGQSYILNPVITEIEDTQTGVKGDIEGALTATVKIYNENVSANTYIDAAGNFLIRGIPDGSYVVQVQAVDETTNELKEITVPGVVIISGRITDMETIQI